ncbi:MAG: deoxyguanosinetriphosphate triphosphohydrolase [Alphaproteobacteria bacterium]|nr:deoxyguanosinetriphosphate triphosphohydrolase [Alphaproteobacteria bacterium]MBE8220587.1 deoxyguanosinetriphosphate triphosphohydrolase [Alphaproteobacteria bacterium]
MHASYASHPEHTRGRLHREPESKTRTCFQRDRDRILHAGAFRRLKHKTQVFVAHVGDSYRTRLTHSLEVSQIARSIARQMGLNEDLIETLALAHDLGHTPFGHAGEDALHAAMKNYGGFDHNAQGLRILTQLERRYIHFSGLNMTWETLEGLVKHNGPLLGAGKTLDDLPFAIREYTAQHDLQLDSFASAEAQIAALSDDIAYNNHDIDDGVRVGLLTLEDLQEVAIVGRILHDIEGEFPAIDASLKRHELVRRMISVMIADLVEETQTRIRAHDVKTADDIRSLGQPLAAFSAAMEIQHKELKAFLYERMYRHHTVNRSMSKARHIVRALFDRFFGESDLMPTHWAKRIEAVSNDDGGEAAKARIICDYIAGMTDRFAMEEHNHLFNIADNLA